MISWPNPTKEQAHWDLDIRSDGVLAAIDVAREVTGPPTSPRSASAPAAS